MEDNNWQRVSAEIVHIEPSLLRSGYCSEGMHEVFAATFHYVVDGKNYSGTMYVGNPDRVGEVFDILYDPDYPTRNTAPDQTVGGRW